MVAKQLYSTLDTGSLKTGDRKSGNVSNEKSQALVSGLMSATQWSFESYLAKTTEHLQQ